MVEQVSIPEGFSWNWPSRQQIIRIQDHMISGTDLPERLNFYLRCGQRAGSSEIIFELSDPSILEIFGQFRWYRPRIRVLISDDQLGDIHRFRARFSTVCPTLVLERCENSLPKAVQFMASLNLPIEINPCVFISQNEKSLLDVCERLLFSSFVKIPVQPFFSFLQFAMNPGTFVPFPTLWETFKERIGRDYYITNDGKITLSKRWADKNRFFGNAFDTIEDIRSSDLFYELVSINEMNSEKSSVCRDCPIHRFCSGYLRAMNATHDCSTFLSLYEFLCSHVSSIKESFVALPKEKKRDVFRAIATPVQRPPDRLSQRRKQIRKPTSVRGN